MQPIVLTSVTTASGFLSMNAIDAPPFHDLGNITAIGGMAALAYSLVFLPALVAIVPVKARAKANGKAAPMDRLAELVIARRRPLLWGMTAVVVVLCAFIPRIELDDQFVRYFDKTIQFRSDTDYTQANLTGLYQFEFSVKAGPNGVSDPDYLRRLDAFVTWLRGQPKTVHVSALTDTMKRLNRNMHADKAVWYKLPGEQTLAAQYLLLYEMSLPFGLDLTDTIDIGKTSTRVVVTLKEVSAGEMRAMANEANAWIAKNFPPEMKAAATGASLMFANISGRNIKGMLKGTLMALVLISVLLIVAFRSVRFGLLSLIPNLVPAGMAFGAWGLLVGQVNMAVAVVAALSLGVVVDDTIHFLSKYLRARRERGAEAADAVRYAFSTVGVALSVTTLILTAGFMILAQSSFALNAEMGLLTAITIVIALLVDFLLLPPLLIKMEGKTDDATVALPA
jgi:predicted RND superfamily exporter protein